MRLERAMYRIGLKAFFNELYIYFRGWRISLLLILTLIMLLFDHDSSIFINCYLIFIIWTLFIIKSSTKKSKKWKLMDLLPSDAHLRACSLVSTAIGMIVCLAIWRICIYMIDILLCYYTVQRAVHNFFQLDLLFFLLLAIPGIYVNNTDYRNIKCKKLYYFVLILSEIIICTHMMLFILDLKRDCLDIPLTLLAYIGTAAIWYVHIKAMRIEHRV